MKHPKVVEYHRTKYELVEQWEQGYRTLYGDQDFLVQVKDRGRWDTVLRCQTYVEAFDKILEIGGRWVK